MEYHTNIKHAGVQTISATTAALSHSMVAYSVCYDEATQHDPVQTCLAHGESGKPPSYRHVDDSYLSGES